jgi:hypothetical protein
MIVRTTGTILGAILLLAPALEAQQASRGAWRELLESRVRPAYRYTHPAPPDTACAVEALPANGYLVTTEEGGSIGRTWLPGTNQSRWETLVGPQRPDTLPVRVVELWCAPSRTSVLVEADGYYLEIAADRLARVADTGEVTAGILLMDGPLGRVPVLHRERCDGPLCTHALLDAEGVAGEIRSVTSARQEAQRRELEEAERRAEQLRAGRAQAASAAQARVEGLSRLYLAETLQRYGATEAQARAIMERRVLTGMTPAMVRAALGDPTATRVEAAATGPTTIWSYPGRELDFVDGRLTAVRGGG